MAKPSDTILNTRAPAPGKGLSLDERGLVPTNATGTGEAGDTVFLRGDRTWATPTGIVPSAHATTHQPGGTDAMAVDAAAGTGSLRTLSTTSTSACAGNDSRLSDARTPTEHDASHRHDGSDPLVQETRIAPTLAGTWANLGGAFKVCGYWKDHFGIVHIEGAVKAGTGTIFTLNSGYRPSATIRYTTGGDGLFATVDITSAGVVALTIGTGTGSLFLDGITFRV